MSKLCSKVEYPIFHGEIGGLLAPHWQCLEAFNPMVRRVWTNLVSGLSLFQRKNLVKLLFVVIKLDVRGFDNDKIPHGI